MVHSLGYRYRLHNKKLPGKPDLTFMSRKKIIFVHGCFWHRHPDCKKASMPKTRTDYWKAKFENNVKRDEHVQNELKNLGWKILIVWECETHNLIELKLILKSFLEK